MVNDMSLFKKGERNKHPAKIVLHDYRNLQLATLGNTAVATFKAMQGLCESIQTISHPMMDMVQALRPLAEKEVKTEEDWKTIESLGKEFSRYTIAIEKMNDVWSIVIGNLSAIKILAPIACTDLPVEEEA